MEGKFLNMPNVQEGNHFARKHKNLSDEKFQNLKGDWEKREIRDTAGRAWEHVGKYEIKMTPHQREIIAFAVEAVNDVLDEYDQDMAKASVDFIKIVKKEFFEKMNSEKSSGVYLNYLQLIAVNDGKNLSDTALAETAFHELLHMFSFQRSVIKGGNSNGYASFNNE